MNLRLLFPALLAALSTLMNAQEMPPSWEPGTWPVVLDGVALSTPWVGGLTAPQWSAFDADLDGDDDLFAFDRDGSRVLMFERIPGEDLTLRWDWTEGWPDMVDWCLLRDYNCDGKPDIFTSHQNGIRVFANTTQPGEGPSFDPEPVTLFATFDLIGSDPSDLPVICLGMDLPAIMDHDDDGDLDIITFTETASTLYRFEGQTPCGLDLECTNRCYGMLAEAAENNALFIGDDFECSFNVENPGMVISGVSRTGLHAGGALTSLQLEPGGPKDLIISDVTYPEALAVVLEVGPSSLDSATYVDPTFPSNLYGDQAVNLARFPAAFHLDVDQDGVRDLLFSPNTPLETNDDESVHFFRNTGTEDEPAWQFITDTYLQDGMIDLGRGAYPSFHDFDGDGLLDLAVANKERYEGVDQTPAAVAVFRNAGTATEPQFDLVDLNWIALVDFQIESPYPAFGDLDGDGDLDMVVGEKNGTLTLFERTSVGSWSKYISPIHGENWGNILVDNLLGINGYSVPALTPTSEGLRVFVANETGTVQDFGLASDNWDAELLEVNNAVFGGREGFRCAAAIADVDNDGLLDALVGIQNGGLISYSSSTDTVIVDAGFLPAWEWQVMPNPGRDAFRWRSAQPWSGELTAWSVTGKKVGHVVVQGQREGAMETSAWAPGTYVIRPVHAPGSSKGVPMGTPLTWIKLPE